MQGSVAVKVRYLDASALVKLYVDEPQSDVVRAFVNAEPKPFQTTTLCFAEALNVLKRKWLNGLSTQAYLNAVHHLIVDAWGNAIEIQDFGLLDPFVESDIDRMVTAYVIDVSDALQLLTIAKGVHSIFVGESRSVLITADARLAQAADSEHIRVWNCTDGPAPSWA